MTEETTPSASVITDATVTVPVEQKSPELVTTEPLTPELSEEAVEPVKAPETVIVDDSEKQAKDLSREMFRDRIRADELERQLAALKPKEEPLGERPKIDSFNTLEEYDAAVDKWAERKGVEKANQQFNQSRAQQEQLAIKAQVASRESVSRTKHADFDTVIQPLVPVFGAIPVLKQFIGENDMGTEVAYHLAKNPAMLDELTRMTPFNIARQLISLETKLKNPAIVQQSNAPEPIKPVGSRETIKPKLADLATKDVNGFIAKRNKEELARKRAN